uniref:Serpin family protein n=1 Tax=Roseihalotalea indica TaxID=2867963 RepID=A0AA49JG46_9BACT|nr:serpin family protein [Tunicatimonas sp. TK19036]
MKYISLPQRSLILFIFIFLTSSQCREEPLADMKNPPDLRPLSATTETLVETSNNFAIDLFRSIQQENTSENVFISPLSVDIALHMTVNGGSGDTKAVMKETLGVVTMSDEEVNQAAKSLTDQLLGMDRQVILSIANSIWYQDVLTLQPGFDALIQNFYDGRIEGLSFTNPEAKETINDWVEDKTQGKIKNLIEEITPDDVMFLINAIYFKANWQYQFDPSQTHDEPFYLADGTSVPVKMMSNKGTKLHFLYREDLQLLDIPYGNGQFSMTIVLPQGDHSVDELIDQLSEEKVADWLGQADTTTTQLMLPKFKTEFKLDLKDVLAGMGMELPFTPDASFHNFFAQNIGENLYIDRVIHQSFIEVAEEGSEAAAATAVVISYRSSNSSPEPTVIRVDRPFVYFIREKHTQAILFAGTMLNPSH